MEHKHIKEKEIPLKYPVTLEGKQYSVLKMRRSKVRDFLAIDDPSSTDKEREVRLIARLCNVPFDVIADLDGADYKAFQETLADFLEN